MSKDNEVRMDEFVKLTHGAPLEPVLRTLVEMIPAEGAEDEAVVLVRHIMEFAIRAKSEGITARVDFVSPCYDVMNKVLRIPAPVGPGQYAAALHEFGHAFGPKQDPIKALAWSLMVKYGSTAVPSNIPEYPDLCRASVTAEIGAWEWAIENAKVWTREMSEASVQAFASYIMKESVAGACRPEYFLMLETIARKGHKR
jgi:hypothetical protein